MPVVTTSPLSQERVAALEAEVIVLLRAGNKIGAIKHHRIATGMGLAESKQAVEALAARHQIVAPPGQGLPAGVVVGFAVLAAAMVWWFLRRR